MSRILFFLVAIVAVLLAILVFAPGIIPTAAFKPRIEAAASNAMGREVTIGDELSFRLLPRAAFHVEELTIANAQGFDGDYLMRVAEADIGVDLFKLLTNAVEVDRFVLTAPEINLARAADGSVNWNLAEGGGETADESTESAAGRSFRDLRLGDVRIIDGKADFHDGAANKTYAAEDIDLKIVLNSLNEPLEMDGRMIFQGEPTKVDIVLTNLANLMAKEPANLKLDMTIGKTKTGADLTIETKEALRYSGPVDLNAPDLPAFAALVGTELADAPGFDRLSFSGDVDGGGDALRLSGANIGFDDIKAEGVLNLDWSGPRPKAGGVLSTDKLDLRPYMPPPATSPNGFPEWSTAKMDFSSLRNIDADFDISTNAIFLNDLKIGESRLKLRIENGRMTTDIPELAMYGGQGSGRLVVNARGGTPSFSGNLDMNAVEAQPLSLDLLKNDNLLGLGSFKFDFTASGASQAAIMSSLDGDGGFDIANGAIKGVNIAKIVRSVATLQEGINPAALASAVTAARGADEETDFSEFLSNFKITDGLVNAPTISLNGPYLTMSGNGAINLPLQTIDLRLSPRATTTADGKDGRTFAIPLRVGGTFTKPTISIDAEALLRSGAEKQIRGLIEGIGKRDEAPAEGEQAAPEEEASTEEKALRAIEGLFGTPKDEDPASGDNGGSASAGEDLATEALGALFGKIGASDEQSEDAEPEQ